MKRMKKVTAMLITASMLFGLCACGDSSADNAGQGAETQTPAQERHLLAVVELYALAQMKRVSKSIFGNIIALRQRRT